MADSNSYGDDNDGRSSPSPSHLGHVGHHGLPIGGVEGPSAVDEDNSMDTDSHHHHHPHTELIITQHSHLDGEADDDDDDEIELGASKGKGAKPQSKIKKKAGGSGRRRIEIKFIENKSRRQVTFSRRKRGLMKKAYELTTLTGTQALVLIASETGHVYTFATPKLQPVVTLREGKELIQSCLNAPDNNYPPSDFMPNAGGGGGGGGNGNNGGNGGGGSGGNSPQAVHQTPKSEPHSSPQLSHSQQGLHHQHQQHQQHGMPHQASHIPPQHAQHPQHNPAHHDPMLSGLYSNSSHVPHGSPYSPHMNPGYPHDMYLPGGGQQTLPPMSLGQHLPHHVDGKGRDHHLQ